MSKNSVLQFSSFLLRFIEFLFIGIAIVIVLVIGYSLIDPDALSSVWVMNAGKPGYISGSISICEGCESDSNIFLRNLSAGMKIWLLLRTMALIILTILIIRTIRKVVKSVQSNATFYEGNVQNFRRMSSYGVIIAIISSFNIFIQSENTNIAFIIPFSSIGFILGCLLLAEIFKEGKELVDDKKSIV